MKAILFILFTFFFCSMLTAQDSVKVVKEKHFEVYIPAGSLVTAKHPSVLIDLDKATMYFIKSKRYDSLAVTQPELEEEFRKLEDSLQRVYKEADSLNVIFAQRDSTGVIAFQSCEKAKDQALATLYEQRGKYVKARRKEIFWRKVSTISIGGNVLTILALLLLL